MKRSPKQTVFLVAYALLAANFILPTLVYIFAPATAIQQFTGIGDLFNVEYGWSEESRFWWVLGVGNVATLGFCCVLLLVDLVRFYPVLVPLVFLKACSVVMFGAQFLAHRYPGFLAASLFDALTCVLFVVAARGAYRERVASA